ncbi:pilus assembly protein [Vibrio sp. T187]|uniref:TadE/TadG family type IV pilus assembly protein n=1 Tax=Vibrio TaxID=662 RepID=UPI0010C9FB82|nr:MULTISPECIES: TadE/TadG family type IV pilus assembly protein [Vibrio]MBW3698325.1 pilus assembly protein [Vibrio sp. T187]
MSLLKQKGLAAVELVIGIPVLLLLLVGVLEVARVFIELNTLNKAVRVGARYASTQTDASGCGPVMADQSDIKQLVVYGTLNAGTSALLNNWQTSDITVSCENNLYVTVSAVYTFEPKFVSTIPATEISLAVPMNASTVMRIVQ